MENVACFRAIVTLVWLFCIMKPILTVVLNWKHPGPTKYDDISTGVYKFFWWSWFLIFVPWWIIGCNLIIDLSDSGFFARLFYDFFGGGLLGAALGILPFIISFIAVLSIPIKLLQIVLFVLCKLGVMDKVVLDRWKDIC